MPYSTIKAQTHRQSLFASSKMTTHQLKLQFRALSPPVRLVVLAAAVVICILIYRLSVFVFITDISYNTDSHLCPACYGTRMCRKIHETSVHGVEKIHLLNKLSNVKNVYFGRINGEEFVYKKLAHDAELAVVDDFLCNGGLVKCREHQRNKICAKSSDNDRCDIQKAATLFTERLTGPVRPDEVIGLSDATHCPTQRMVQRMVNRYQERSIITHEHGLSAEDKFMLLYTLSVNSEPIVLQMFPQGEGWPFPAYVGACGRMIAVQNAGVPLRDYINSDYKTRLRLSLNLLRIAEQLTDNASGFALYFSDVSLDNYAVDPSTLSVYITDAENVMIVDQVDLQSKASAKSKSSHHISMFDECKHGGNCLTVDVDGLCSNVQADFNYYAVCRSLLSSYAVNEQEPTYHGLLHSLPQSNPKLDHITKLVDECANPPHGKSRLVIKEELLNQLADTVKSFKTSSSKT